MLIQEERKATRFERRREELIQVAKTGKFFANCEIFEGEIKKLKKEGLLIFPVKKKKLLNRKVRCIISWDHAFHEETLTLWHLEYVFGEVYCKPPTRTLAEELSLITMRAEEQGVL